MAEEAEKSSKYQLDEGFVRRVNDITKEEVPKVPRNNKSVLEEVMPAYIQN